jgi:hypothetical protein
VLYKDKVKDEDDNNEKILKEINPLKRRGT